MEVSVLEDSDYDYDYDCDCDYRVPQQFEEIEEIEIAPC